MLSFLRSDLIQFAAYSSEHEVVHPNSDKLDANEVSTDLPPFLKEQLADFLANGISANRYPDGIYLELKELVSQYVGVSSQSVSLGNGSDELIRSLLIVSCLGRGDVLIAEPTFSMYSILAGTLGINVHRACRSVEDFTIDILQAQELLDGQNIAAIFVVHPNSPTGNLLTNPEIAWLRSVPPNILVVIDEAYFEFSGNTLVPELENYPNWVILRTFSKAFRLAAFRVGYALAHPDLIRILEKIRLPYNLPTISSVAAAWAVANQKQLLSLVPEIITERENLYRSVQAIPGCRVWPSQGNFLYLRTPHDRELMTSLRQQGTFIRCTGGGLRITIGTPSQNQRTLERLTS